RLRRVFLALSLQGLSEERHYTPITRQRAQRSLGRAQIPDPRRARLPAPPLSPVNSGVAAAPTETTITNITARRLRTTHYGGLALFLLRPLVSSCLSTLYGRCCSGSF